MIVNCLGIVPLDPLNPKNKPSTYVDNSGIVPYKLLFWRDKNVNLLFLLLSMLIALPDNISWRWLFGVNIIQTHHQLNQCHVLGRRETNMKNDSLTIFTDNKKKTWQSTEQRSRLTSLLLKFMMRKMINCAFSRELWELSLDHRSKRITIGKNR